MIRGVSDDIEMGNREEGEAISRVEEVWTGVFLYFISIYNQYSWSCFFFWSLCLS